jgi:hypothetical protein
MYQVTFQATTKEFAAKIKQEYAVAAAILKYMESLGKAKEIAKRPAVGGKGKPSSVYQIESSLNVDFTTNEFPNEFPEDQTNEFEALHS